MTERLGLLVLGLGNVLCGDDGLGAAAVHLLQQAYRAPEGVRVLDGGTLGLALLPMLQDAEQVLIIDAIRAGGVQPGSTVRIAGADVPPAVRERLSPHQIGVADLLDAAQLTGRSPERMVLVGLVPRDLELGVGLSPAVERAMPRLVETILAETRALGFEFLPRPCDEYADRLHGAGDVVSVLGLRRPGR